MDKQARARTWIWFSVLLSVSTALRIYRLDMGFWMDEVITITEFVRKPWLIIITQVPFPNNHILYTLLAKLSVSIFGEKEWSARLPAMIIGSFIPPVAYLVFRKRFSEYAAVCAGIFLCLNFWSVWFSQDARGYSALILFSLLSTNFLTDYLEKRRSRPAVYYLICAALCVWFYLYALFVIAGQLLWALIMTGRKKISPGMVLPIILSGILGLMLYAPSLEKLWHYAISQQKMASLHSVNLIFLRELLSMLAGLKNHDAIICLTLAALLGLGSGFKRWPGFFFISLVSGLGIILFTLLAGVFIYARFLAFLLPAFALGMALALDFWKIPARFLKTPGRLFNTLLKALKLALVICLILICGLLTFWLRQYYIFGKQGFRDAAEWLKARPAGQQVICYGIICQELAYYFPDKMIELSEKQKLDPDFIKGKVIISRRNDWTADNLELAATHCFSAKVWPSAGYKENLLLLLNCPGQD